MTLPLGTLVVLHERILVGEDPTDSKLGFVTKSQFLNASARLIDGALAVVYHDEQIAWFAPGIWYSAALDLGPVMSKC